MRWTLRRKILAGYGLVLLLLLLVLAWSLFNLRWLGTASEEILSENFRSILAAENMVRALHWQQSGVLLYLLGYEDEGLQQYRAYQTEFARWFGQAQGNVTIEDEAAVLARIDSVYAAYLDAFAYVSRNEGSTDRAYLERVLPAFGEVREASNRLLHLNQQTMINASQRAQAVGRRAVWSVGLIGLGALALGLVFSLILSNRLVRPIREMEEASLRIAEGDYDVEVATRTSDELGGLAAQFDDMAARLRDFHALNVEKIIAEQQRAEAIIQSINDGLVVVDAAYEIVSMNPAAEVALDVDRRKAQGRRFPDVFRNEALFDHVRQTAESGRPPALDERESFFSTRRNGEKHHYQHVITPVRAPSGERLGVILLLRDVTEFKKVDRLKSEFVATASHELKTPLTSIAMAIGLLQEQLEGRLDEQAAELLAAAREDVERLRLLVNDLLDLSKIEAGRIELTFTSVSVSMLVEKATQTLRVQAEEHGVALINEVSEDLPAVRADANKITWVLTNLISNALRYTASGGHIRLSAEQVASGVEVSVADDGAGIPYEHQSRIFDKFVQVDNDQSLGGSGLGLAICKEIVRAHGGSIWVDSVPGEGSTFTFSLRMA